MKQLTYQICRWGAKVTYIVTDPNNPTEEWAYFTDKEDAQLFCAMPELIQLLKKQIFSFRMADEDEEKMMEILKMFDPNFEYPSQEPSPSSLLEHAQSVLQDWSLSYQERNRRQCHMQDDLPCGDVRSSPGPVPRSCD